LIFYRTSYLAEYDDVISISRVRTPTVLDNIMPCLGEAAKV
jgi:hypothetical protein